MKDKINVCYILILAILLGGLAAFLFSRRDKKNPTLELVHLIIRHGERYPDKSSVCPGTIYCNETYFPEGYGQLTIAGKRREYDIGIYLRTRYDDFLGQKWHINYVDARSTHYSRTQMSLQLVLAGLYPPTSSQVWSSLNWQPIPCNYVPKFEDKELLPFFVCPRYEELNKKICEEPQMRKYLSRYNETFQILQKIRNTQIDVIQAFFVYSGLKIQEEMGYPLEEWSKAVYPEPLHSLVIDMYYLMTNTTEVRRIISGYLLKKMIVDTEGKINGTLIPHNRKMFIYSAHEINIATMLLTLGVEEKLLEMPPYGAYVLIEVHKINGIYGIKIFYQNYQKSEPIPQKIQGCDYFCPYDDFYRLMKNYLPVNDDDCYGTSTTYINSLI